MKTGWWILLVVFMVVLCALPVTAERGPTWLWWDWPYLWESGSGWWYVVATSEGLWGWHYGCGYWELLAVNHVGRTE